MVFVLVFGNPEIKEDSLALEIADELKIEWEIEGEKIEGEKIEGVEFVKCSSVEVLNDFPGQEFYILDVVKGTDKVILIDDIEQLKEKKEKKISTLHDFDLGFYLKLLKEIGELPKVKIIGIPIEGEKERIKREVVEIITYNQFTSRK